MEPIGRLCPRFARRGLTLHLTPGDQSLIKMPDLNLPLTDRLLCRRLAEEPIQQKPGFFKQMFDPVVWP